MRSIFPLVALVALGACGEQRAQELAAAQLVDPNSAQFRNVRRVTANGVSRVCGEINGKNRMGAYAGFNRFIVNPESENVQFDQPNAQPKAVAQMELEQCRRPSYGGYVRNCNYDQERYAEAMLAEMFADDWRRYCEPGSSEAGAVDALNGMDIDMNLGGDLNTVANTGM